MGQARIFPLPESSREFKMPTEMILYVSQDGELDVVYKPFVMCDDIRSEKYEHSPILGETLHIKGLTHDS